MNMNETPSGERVHISFFGKRNAGKSSLVNAVTGQEMSIVSDVLGTTTDPVTKSMELLPIGPVVIIDTPGYDDEGELGELRIKKTKEILNRSDLAVLAVDGTVGLSKEDCELLEIFKQKQIPAVVAFTKSDLSEFNSDVCPELDFPGIAVSAKTQAGIWELKELIGKVGANFEASRLLLGDLIKPGDFVMLVVPIDSAAPKGRLILPQQQVLRDILDHGAQGIVVKEDAIESTLARLKEKPALVVTDSQVFKRVAAAVPEDIPLTSFSILLARYKGFLKSAIEGVAEIGRLKEGAHILISEGCTHHRQCEDIGTVKLPKWIREYTGKDFTFETSSGNSFPEDLSRFDLVVHCGGCMVNAREMSYRMKQAADRNVPFTNYGITIAEINGILKRSVRMLPEIRGIL